MYAKENLTRCSTLHATKNHSSAVENWNELTSTGYTHGQMRHKCISHFACVCVCACVYLRCNFSIVFADGRECN